MALTEPSKRRLQVCTADSVQRKAFGITWSYPSSLLNASSIVSTFYASLINGSLRRTEGTAFIDLLDVAGHWRISPENDPKPKRASERSARLGAFIQIRPHSSPGIQYKRGAFIISVMKVKGT